MVYFMSILMKVNINSAKNTVILIIAIKQNLQFIKSTNLVIFASYASTF